jgi:hypothetical protein
MIDCRLPDIPNVVVMWLAFLLRVREVSVSNLGPETGSLDRFSCFPPVLSGECRDSTLKLDHDHLSQLTIYSDITVSIKIMLFK